MMVNTNYLWVLYSRLSGQQVIVFSITSRTARLVNSTELQVDEKKHFKLHYATERIVAWRRFPNIVGVRQNLNAIVLQKKHSMKLVILKPDEKQKCCEPSKQ